MGEPLKQCKVGLALSGGGFRASIFHLGVIRRLEELGLMVDVEVISAVSGGSIIAAYYVIEMERRLRHFAKEFEGNQSNTKPEDTRKKLVELRVKLFEEIAKDFLRVVNHNLRTRALIFHWFFHPLLAVKSLGPGQNRSDVIQREYDKWLYHDATLDELPSVTIGRVQARSKKPDPILVGPQLVLNTTSLMTGQRKPFFRVPVSGMTELKTPNRNVLRLSRIVGASSGVPVVFPPTSVEGELLVDGGVSDNQGIEELVDQTRNLNVLLVSDASGQMESVHVQSSAEPAVYARVNEIFQFQIRNKLLDRLLDWKFGKSQDASAQLSYRDFAFVHLFLNLKDRGVKERVSSEFIPALARIRTDLDQFSYVERETLMYHGYTLIDAQIKEYCQNTLCKDYRVNDTPLTVSALFSEESDTTTSGDARSTSSDGRNAAPEWEVKRHETIRKELEYGHQKLFLYRSWKKYPVVVSLCEVAGLIVFLAMLATVQLASQLPYVAKALTAAKNAVNGWLAGVIPGPIKAGLDLFLGLFGLPNMTTIIDAITPAVSALILYGGLAYIVIFLVYSTVRQLSIRLDQRSYSKLTGGRKFSTEWKRQERAQE